MLKLTLPILISIWAVGVQLSLPATAGEAAADIPGMTWGMLPGESLEQLAKLIYPHSPEMQRRFAEASLALNREQLPDLDSAAPFNQLTVLQIPDIKALARTASAEKSPVPALRLSRQRQIATIHTGAPLEPEHSGIDLQLTLQIESLEKRNQVLKQQQAMLSERLDLMEGNLRAMQAIVNEPRQRKPRKIPPAKSIKHERQPATGDSLQLMSGTMVIGGLAGAVVMGLGWWLYRRRRSPAAAVVAKLVPAIDSSLDSAQSSPNSATAGKPVAGAVPVIAKPVTQPPVDDHLNVSMHVDEIESIVEEARVYVALGRSEQAIEMLNEYIETHPRISVNPWLYLLDLHRAGGRKSEFSTLAKRMHQTFNVMAPTWEASAVAMVVPTTLEEFPHILGKLTDSWGSKECHDYLNGLIQDNRDGERAGFSLEVLEEILLLLAVLDIREALH